MRISLVIGSLEAGGAERVMSIMANCWAASGNEISLVTISSANGDWYPLNPTVNRIALSLASPSRHTYNALWNNVRRVAKLRRVLRTTKPDVVISFLDTTNVLALLAGMGLGIPVIVSERVDPHQHPIERAWDRMRSWLYCYAKAVVVQTDSIREWAERFVPSRAISVIPNPVRQFNIVDNTSRYPGIAPTVVAMGRLTRQKGFDLLIKAFAQCAERHCDWSLVILGEGEERARLETMVAEFGLKDRVSLPGIMQNPERLLSQAELFVLSSRYEGFPNALLEAMACGIAVIATDCPSGPRDIIRHGIDGLLVPREDVQALSDALNCLMGDPHSRRRLGQPCRHRP